MTEPTDPPLPLSNAATLSVRNQLALFTHRCATSAEKQSCSLCNKKLSVCLQLMRGSRVKLSETLCAPLGLNHNATGTVVGFLYDSEKTQPIRPYATPLDIANLIIEGKSLPQLPIVLVKFDKGTFTGPSFVPQTKRVVPIIAVSHEVNLGGVVYKRWQLPLELAFTCTVHCVQGLTVQQVVFDPTKCNFADNLAYVALSRVRTLSSLFLFAPMDKNSIPKRKGQGTCGLKSEATRLEEMGTCNREEE